LESPQLGCHRLAVDQVGGLSVADGPRGEGQRRHPPGRRTVKIHRARMDRRVDLDARGAQILSVIGGPQGGREERQWHPHGMRKMTFHRARRGCRVDRLATGVLAWSRVGRY
jgi:hypothetical protein